MNRLLFRSLLIGFSLTGLHACASYYQRHLDFNAEFEQGHIKQALEALRNSDTESFGKTRFIYYENKGLLLSMLGEYEESNVYFEKAFLFGEDYRINYFNEASSYLTNPNMTVYRGEDHEHLLVLYFKAINFLKMNKPEEALVECRRLNIRLNQLGDKYTSEDKLQRNAFIHTLMGIIYQSTKDYNNAFIAYRNALEVYENDYAKLFGIKAPGQLKKDLLETAWRTGFLEEFENYKTRFDMPDYFPSNQDADLIFFWHNGLGPIKDEWSVNFVITPGPGNTMVFSNGNLGLVLPYTVDDQKDRADLGSLEVFRVAFPRYVERPPYFQSATLETASKVYPLQMAEDINKVAFYSLKQRMLQEFAKGLLRAALKKAAEQGLRKKDDTLGAILGLVNALTEKADTRNWQTLPHTIYYSRLPLTEGSNEVRLTLIADDQRLTEYTFNYIAKKQQTLFHTFSSLETSAPQYRYY
ncbi:MAG: hypothetical protein OEV74_02255 [Cyclobacteriaceae bacterium]|nr:hypothetical protein [Cyclobacteriaceae bacterium]MDH4295075.1 hypothetical protein [Cyclobacteriaceae bacterium]MDH5248859.1 hypothetical protein [Cyclobacteriaceae bacterium]